MPESMTVDSIAKSRHEEAVGLLEDQLSTAKGQIETDLQHTLSAMRNQYNIQRRAMSNKFNHEPDVDKRNAIVAQMEQLNTTFAGREQAIKDKTAPALQQITQASQQAMAKLNRQFELQQKEVQTIRKLALAGEVTPTVAKQKALAAIGIDVPLSQFQKVGSVEQRKTILEDDIRDITTFLNRFSVSKTGAALGVNIGRKIIKYTDPSIVDVEGDAVVRTIDPGDPRSPDAPLLKQRSALMRALKEKEQEFGRLLVEANPQLQSAVKKNERRRHARDVLAGTSERGGGLGPSFENILANNPRTKDTLPPAAETVKSLAAQGLGREQIREQMEALGYK